jgi:hypothetical protein
MPEGKDFYHNLSYFDMTPELILGHVHALDDYLLCFCGPTDDCIELSNRIIDKFYSECTAYSPSERRRRAKWLKTEMKRRLLADSIPSSNPTGTA